MDADTGRFSFHRVSECNTRYREGSSCPLKDTLRGVGMIRSPVTQFESLSVHQRQCHVVFTTCKASLRLYNQPFVTGSDWLKSSDQFGQFWSELILLSPPSAKGCSWIRQNSGVNVCNCVCPLCPKKRKKKKAPVQRPDDNVPGPFCAGSKS